MTAVTFSSMVKPGTFLLKVKPLFKHFSVLLNAASHTIMTRLVSLENHLMVNQCIGQHSVHGGNYLCYISFVAYTCVCCDRIYGIENYRVDCDIFTG